MDMDAGQTKGKSERKCRARSARAADHKEKVRGIVLAAGRGKRMKSN